MYIPPLKWIGIKQDCNAALMIPGPQVASLFSPPVVSPELRAILLSTPWRPSGRSLPLPSSPSLARVLGLLLLVSREKAKYLAWHFIQIPEGWKGRSHNPFLGAKTGSPLVTLGWPWRLSSILCSESSRIIHAGNSTLGTVD